MVSCELLECAFNVDGKCETDKVEIAQVTLSKSSIEVSIPVCKTFVTYLRKDLTHA